MEMTRKMGQAMNVSSNARPPMRQNTFVIEDRNVMRLGEGEHHSTRNGQEDRRNGQQKTNKVVFKTPTNPTKTVVITSKTDSGQRGQIGDGEWNQRQQQQGERHDQSTLFFTSSIYLFIYLISSFCTSCPVLCVQ